MKNSIVASISYPLLIDGGLSNQLEAQGCNLNHPLWTAHLLETDPEAIVKSHLAYLKAGAQCITTASYQVSKQGFVKFGIDEHETDLLLLKSVNLAKEAIDSYMKSNPGKARPLIAASIGPYGAFLADGSEYHGNYGLSDKELMDFHAKRIQLLNTSEADVFAIETIPSAQEARILARILEDSHKPAWLCFSCQDDELLNDGTPIAASIIDLNQHPKIFALGVNCTHPGFISGLINTIKPLMNDKKIIVYPNLGESYDAITKTWVGESEVLFNEKLVLQWIELGADIVGGCCRVGPIQIKKVGDAIFKPGSPHKSRNNCL